MRKMKTVAVVTAALLSSAGLSYAVDGPARSSDPRAGVRELTGQYALGRPVPSRTLRPVETITNRQPYATVSLRPLETPSRRVPYTP